MTREEAIKMLNRLLLYCDECPHGDCEKCVEAINMAEDALEQQTCDNKGMNDNFEALDQEPKQGKWEHYLKEGLKWKCSECGSKYTTPWHYCPNCGARMKGADDE